VISKPRFALLAGAIFIVLSVVYGSLSHDVGGMTMLFALGIAMALMAYVLVAGSPRGDEQ
jgi:ABC-type Co2+ transport system permease subunit